jgi:hypothetical protein
MWKGADMSIKYFIFGERSFTRVAAFFANRKRAEAIADQVKHEAGLDDSQVYLLGAPDGSGYDLPTFSRKLEPEPAGIQRTLVRAHIVTGGGGVIAGVVVFLGFFAADSAAVTSTPGISLVAMIFFGAMLGLLAGGLLAARPDHSFVISAVRLAIRRKQWAVLVQPVTRRQLDLSLHELRAHSDRVVRSL